MAQSGNAASGRERGVLSRRAMLAARLLAGLETLSCRLANGHTRVVDCYVTSERPDGSILLDTTGFG